MQSNAREPAHIARARCTMRCGDCPRAPQATRYTTNKDCTKLLLTLLLILFNVPIK